MQTIRAVIWDLDGTLLNTLQDLTDAVNFALGEAGYPSRSLDEVRSFVGNGVPKLIERAVPAHTDAAEVQRVLELFRPHYALHNADATAPYPGITEGLESLHQARVAMAVVSNKLEPAVEALRQRFFPDSIPVAVGDVPARPVKPAPDGTLLALQKLGVAPEEALFVGDSEVDILTARNAGIPCLAVSWGFRSREVLQAHGATAVADTPDEAFAYIRSRL